MHITKLAIPQNIFKKIKVFLKIIFEVYSLVFLGEEGQNKFGLVLFTQTSFIHYLISILQYVYTVLENSGELSLNAIEVAR